MLARYIYFVVVHVLTSSGRALPTFIDIEGCPVMLNMPVFSVLTSIAVMSSTKDNIHNAKTFLQKNYFYRY